MITQRREDDSIRILIADDDEHILECYQEAFTESDASDNLKTLDALDAELFDQETDIVDAPKFDVVILDVRMPPGIDGVEAGSKIRELDPDVEIVFVTGFSDVPREELERRVPPPMRLHYFNKPISFMKLAEDVASIVKSH